MRRSFIAAISMCMSLCVPAFAEAPDFAGEQFEAREGFFTLQVDTDTNKVYAVLPEADEDGVVLRWVLTAETGIRGRLWGSARLATSSFWRSKT